MIIVKAIFEDQKTNDGVMRLEGILSIIPVLRSAEKEYKRRKKPREGRAKHDHYDEWQDSNDRADPETLLPEQVDIVLALDAWPEKAFEQIVSWLRLRREPKGLHF